MPPLNRLALPQRKCIHHSDTTPAPVVDMPSRRTRGARRALAPDVLDQQQSSPQPQSSSQQKSWSVIVVTSSSWSVGD
jgi:hypothetical protein